MDIKERRQTEQLKATSIVSAKGKVLRLLMTEAEKCQNGGMASVFHDVNGPMKAHQYASDILTSLLSKQLKLGLLSDRDTHQESTHRFNALTSEDKSKLVKLLAEEGVELVVGNNVLKATVF